MVHSKRRNKEWTIRRANDRAGEKFFLFLFCSRIDTLFFFFMVIFAHLCSIGLFLTLMDTGVGGERQRRAG